MVHTIGIAEMKVSSQEDDVLVTYSLGSCMGLALYDPVVRVGGMMHSMLPMSQIDAAKARANPAMFTDTAVEALLEAVLNLGAMRPRLVAKVAGAASLLDDMGLFKIGERNYTVLRRLLWKNSILIAGEAVGGTMGRTMYLYMATGKTTVRSSGREVEL